MAAYKVIQDVEAEDKLLGPLTLRQFIYAGIAVVFLFVTYFAGTHHAGFLAVFFVPIACVSAFFAFPWGSDQPTEVWALAKIRFLLKPRRRIWDQSGAKQLVDITAPKEIITDYTNGLSQTEVKSRLQALADTIDSRGWAIKNAEINAFSQPALILQEPNSDRLVAAVSAPQQPSDIDIRAADDILDEQNNPTARNVATMVNASSKARRKKIVDSLQSSAPTPAAPANNYWFLNQPAQPISVPGNMVTFNTQVVAPGTDDTAADTPLPDEATIVKELKAKQQALPANSYYSHLHTIQPLSAQQAPAQPVQLQPPAPQAQTSAATQPPTAPAVTAKQQAAILELSRRNDLSVATLAREAERAGPQDEVVIKLH